MDGDSEIGTVEQNGCKPRLHELLARDIDGSLICGYLVVEVTQSSFSEACSYIRDTDWLHNGLAPLVLSHFPLSEAETQVLRKRVPWFQAKPDVGTQLQALRAALVIPLERQGLVCVDFADFISVLANGGEARVIQASGATASTAFDHLLAKEEFPEWISDTKAAVSLHIRANPVLSMNEFDEIGRLLESQVTEDSLVVMSIGVWNGRGIELTLLSVSARR